MQKFLVLKVQRPNRAERHYFNLTGVTPSAKVLGRYLVLVAPCFSIVIRNCFISVKVDLA